MTEQAFGNMVVQYEKLVYTICFQFTRSHHTAQDLAQETFLAAWRHIDSCPEEAAKPWLARIATNKAKDYLKSAYNRRVQTPDTDLPDTGNALFLPKEEPEDITLEKESIQRIESEIRALKEPYLKAAVLYFIEEKSVDEISRLLDRPSKTIHTQLYRAKHQLQKKLKGGPDDG